MLVIFCHPLAVRREPEKPRVASRESACRAGVTFRTTRRSNRVELRVGMTRTRWWAAATETRRIAVAKNPDACVDAQGIEVAAERQARGNRAPSHLSSRVRIAAIDMKTVSATADRTRLSPRTSR